MSYARLYIEQSAEKDPGDAAGTADKLYLLPGLIDQHTSSLSPEELVEAKLEYNKWLGFYRKKQDKSLKEALTDSELVTMKEWIDMMYRLLRKIGRYTDAEKMEGFKI
jgi:hypothetical protein